MGKDVKGAIHCTYVHQIKKWQHQPHPLEEIPGSGIAVLDDDRQRSEDGIDDEEINSTGEETLDKTGN